MTPALDAADGQGVGIVDEEEEPVAILQIEELLQRRGAAHGINAVADIGDIVIFSTNVLEERHIVVRRSEHRRLVAANRLYVIHREVAELVEHHDRRLAVDAQMTGCDKRKDSGRGGAARYRR